jgi:hypothetical protein
MKQKKFQASLKGVDIGEYEDDKKEVLVLKKYELKSSRNKCYSQRCCFTTRKICSASWIWNWSRTRIL